MDDLVVGLFITILFGGSRAADGPTWD